jgi:hypothetical protein
MVPSCPLESRSVLTNGDALLNARLNRVLIATADDLSKVIEIRAKGASSKFLNYAPASSGRLLLRGPLADGPYRASMEALCRPARSRQKAIFFLSFSQSLQIVSLVVAWFRLRNIDGMIEIYFTTSPCGIS